MKNTLGLVGVFALALGWSNLGVAQEDGAQGVPVEFFSCNWQKGKDMDDLQRVAEKFSAWTDENQGDYSAWILTPQYHAGLDFDVAWLGSWPDGNAWGKGMDAWLGGGQELAREFDRVIDCSVGHEVATSVVVSAPDGPPGDGLVMFAACELEDDNSFAEVLPAHMKAAATMKSMGSKASSWIFFPGIGGGDDSPDYWQVHAFNNYAELGAATEIYINGGGWEKVMEDLSPVSECATGALFDAHLVRAAPAN